MDCILRNANIWRKATLILFWCQVWDEIMRFLSFCYFKVYFCEDLAKDSVWSSALVMCKMWLEDVFRDKPHSWASIFQILCFFVMSGMVSVVTISEQIVMQLLFSNFVHKNCELDRGVVNRLSVETWVKQLFWSFQNCWSRRDPQVCNLTLLPPLCITFGSQKLLTCAGKSHTGIVP